MTTTPAGWYPDPQDPRLLRYWDGASWTAHVHAVAPAAYAPVPQTTPDGEPLAGWGRRLGAWVIDAVITGITGALVSLPWIIDYARAQWEHQRELSDRMAAGQRVNPFEGMFAGYADLAVATVIAVLVTLAYHALFLRYRSATPGKLMVGLRVRLRGQPGLLTWDTVGKRIAVQFAPGLLGAIPLVGTASGLFVFVDGLWPLWDDKRQAIHEKWAGTNVVRVR